MFRVCNAAAVIIFNLIPFQARQDATVFIRGYRQRSLQHMVAGLFVYIGIYRFFEIRQVIVHNVAQLKKQRTGSGTEGLIEEIP